MVIKHSEFPMIDLNLYNIIDLAFIYFCFVMTDKCYDVIV